MLKHIYSVMLIFFWAVVLVTAPTVSGQSTAGTGFIPVTPCRIADTRNAVGPNGGPMMSANSRRTFPVAGPACGIPAGARAFSLNITVVPGGPLGFLTAWPSGQPQPFVSTLNSFDGRIVANAAIIPSGAGGGIDVFVNNDAHVVIDINGYFDSQAGAFPFFALPPCRAADTREGPLGSPALVASATRSFNIPASPCGVPASAQAYSLNATVVPLEPLAFLTLWPSSQSQPAVSTLNSDGRVVANAAITPAGTSGGTSAFATGATHLIMDVNGYFGSSGSTPALSFFPLTPCRIADTRGAQSPFGGPFLNAGSIRSFVLPQSSCGVPLQVGAYALNITAVPRGLLQYVTIWPGDRPQPLVSTLNSFEGTVVANAAIVPAGPDGSIKVFASDATDLIIDINGYFAVQAPQQPQPNFSLSVDPLSRVITAGGTTAYSVTVQSRDGFSGTVDLTLLNRMNGLASADFIPPSVFVSSNGTATSALRLTAKPDGPFGGGTMTVRAASQQLVHDQNISATIVQPAAPGYTISVNPLSRTIAAGATTTYQVTVASQNDFSGQVALGLANVPNTVLSTFNTDLFTLPANGSVTSTLSLTAQPNSPSATSTITVNAVSLGFPARSQNITLTVTPPQGPQTAQVSIQQFQFSPTPVTVAAGGQVRWTNLDGTQHTVVADGGQFSSGVLGNGQTFSTMPAAPGTYNYHCSIHPSMTGTVIVQ